MAWYQKVGEITAGLVAEEDTWKAVDITGMAINIPKTQAAMQPGTQNSRR